MDLIHVIMLVITILGAAVCFILFIVGLIQGLREPYRPEEYWGESSYRETRIQHTDCFGAWDGYSVPGEGGEIRHYDAFGVFQGTSKKTDRSMVHFDAFGTIIGYTKEEW